MRRLISAGLVKLLVILAATFGVGTAVAVEATASTSSTQVTTPQLDLSQIETILQEASNLGSNNLVQCVLEILSGGAGAHCDHSPI